MLTMQEATGGLQGLTKPARLFGRAGFFTAAPGPGEGTGTELLRHALHVVRQHFGMDVAFIAEIQAGRRVLRYVDADPGVLVPPEGHSDPLEETFCARIADGRLPAVIEDVRRYPAAPAGMGPLPVGSHLGVPIHFSNGALYGTFCCFSARPDLTLNPRDEETMRVFADFVAGALEHEAEDSEGTLQVRQRIERMLEAGDFRIVYQPVVGVASGRIVGYEALTRFGPGDASPRAWFEDAERVGMLQQLEVAVVRKALEALPRLERHIYLSVNVSPETVTGGGLDEALRGVPLRRVVLEITEHASIDDYAALAECLEPWRGAGLRLAVDDAGAGFASFRHILKMRPDDIKLDISLISKIDRDLGARALAAALIRFAKETGSKIVAEGVETETVMQVLRDLRVHKAQGYLLGRPAPLPQA